jgi:hypothetical protein
MVGGEGVMYAHGVENRFTDWSLDRVFGTLHDFAHCAQWQQFRALKYQIEAMRRKPQLAGYAITEFTDVHWESNGLLDMRRNPRVFHDVLRDVNADTVILPGRAGVAPGVTPTRWDNSPRLPQRAAVLRHVAKSC